MTREQIEKAANIEMLSHYADEEYPSDIKDIHGDFIEAFREGAQWRINSVWHDASEEPEQKDEPILVEYEDWGIEGSDYTVCDDIWDYRIRLKRDGAYCIILRWAYMKDLIPERRRKRNEKEN